PLHTAAWLALWAFSFSLPALAEDAPSLGASAAATPGFSHVGFASAPAGSLVVAADACYAQTEALADESAAHHRALGSTALALSLTDWSLVFASVEGHYDWHRQSGEP